MKGPLFVMARLEAGGPQDTPLIDCLKEECAWRYSENDSCAVLTLAQGMRYAHKQLLAISGKMPKDLAPGR